MLTSLLVALVASAAAVPTKSPSIVHEKRELFHASQHRKLQPVSKDAVLPVRIGLTQSNLDRGYDHLMEMQVFNSTIASVVPLADTSQFPPFFRQVRQTLDC